MSPPRPHESNPAEVLTPPAKSPERAAVASVSSAAQPSAAQSSSPLRLATVGEQYDKYTLLAKLATGGMAELFVAELSGAAGFSKKVVIKRILPHVAHDENFIRMFLDEAKACAQINHPNVCQVFELCETDGSHFLVLEHLEGATVGELIRRCLVSEQKLNMRLAAGIIAQACDGLHAAHEQRDDDGRNSNLVHRDVSPGNLFVTVDGIVKVLDFGIAKARWMSRKTKTGTLLGKCEYMSPEQARGGVPLDRRSDIFSLGIITWELLCGRRLFRRESEYETLRAVLRAPIERPKSIRPSIPDALDEAIMCALERDPCDRFRSTHEFRQAITEALRQVGGPTAMCDIAPLIRDSFADELRIQRAVLREASRTVDSYAGAMPSLNPVAMPSLNPVANSVDDDEFACTDVITSEHQRLPSLVDEPEEADSVELTFRELPESPPPTNERRPTPAPASHKSAPVSTQATPWVARPFPTPAVPVVMKSATVPTPRPRRKSDTPPVQQARRSEVIQAEEIVPAASAVVSAPITPETTVAIRDRRATGVLLALTLLLGAGVTTGSMMFFSKGQKKAATVVDPALPQNAVAANSPVRAVAPAKQANDAGGIAGQPAKPAMDSATANAAAQAELMQANRKAEAVVTALPATTGAQPASFGKVRIRSSQPAQVFLYPEKNLLGTTPLDVDLEPGRHKFKIQVGPGKGEKKYFHLNVEASGTIGRNFDHWQ